MHDLPRTSQVIHCTRHYELISEPTLFTAQRALADEIGPEVDHLLRRVEQHLAKLERREKALISKAGLQEQRIEQSRPRVEAAKGMRLRVCGEDKVAKERAEKMKMFQHKRERLEHTIERLQLQVAHKERQLRMSTVYGGW